MTQRLYYEDPYLTRFTGHIVESLQWEGRPAIVLDQTAFYPTGGGQPHDTGTLGTTPVVDVVERAGDHAVVHVLATPLESQAPGEVGATTLVEGRINWNRRFDFMQQHTGQHILSAAFVKQFGATTVGFHLSDEYATIDVDQAPLSSGRLDAVEDLANAAVFENRPTVARWVSDEEVPSIPLRKPVSARVDEAALPVRVVEVSRFDHSACGGTHVRATGEVGLIKITRAERRGEETRVEFLCGRRALADYRAKNTTVMALAQAFTVGHWELDEAVGRLADDLKEARSALRRARDQLLDADALGLWREARSISGVQLVKAHLDGRTPDDLKHLAQRLVAQGQTVALLGTGRDRGEKGYFTFARSEGVEAHMGTLVRQACELIGGRGGGRPAFAQGGAQQADRVGEALAAAAQLLVERLAATDAD